MSKGLQAGSYGASKALSTVPNMTGIVGIVQQKVWKSRSTGIVANVFQTLKFAATNTPVVVITPASSAI